MHFYILKINLSLVGVSVKYIFLNAPKILNPVLTLKLKMACSSSALYSYSPITFHLSIYMPLISTLPEPVGLQVWEPETLIQKKSLNVT